MSYLLVFSTAPTRQEARRLAALLLKKKLSACINITQPVESHYRWKGKKKMGREVLLLIKTKQSLFKRLEKTLRENHSYSVPEVIAVAIQKGSRPYLAWLAQELS